MENKFPWGDITRLVNNVIDPKLNGLSVKLHSDMTKRVDELHKEHDDDMANMSNEFNNLNQRFEEVMSLAEQLIQLEHEHHEDVEAINKRIDELELSSSTDIDAILEQIKNIEKQHQSDLTNITNQISGISNSVTNINTKIKIDPDGGIVNGGKGLAVDFSKMPTDKMEALLKTLRVPIWLTANKNFYVDSATGSDTLDDGRGESLGKPFKTIQACVNYITDNYNFSRYIAVIRVVPGNYDRFAVGNFQVTTGELRIMNHSPDNGEVNVRSSWVDGKGAIDAIAILATGYIRIYNFSIWNEITYNDTLTRLIHDGSCIKVSKGTVSIYGCKLHARYSGAGDFGTVIALKAESGGICGICNDNEFDVVSTSPSVTTIECLDIDGFGSQISYANINPEQFAKVNMSVAGPNAGAFINIVNGGYFYRSKTLDPGFVTVGMSGFVRQYVLYRGGTASTSVRGVNYFPGNQPGIVDEAHGSWIE